MQDCTNIYLNNFITNIFNIIIKLLFYLNKILINKIIL